ncbi:MAG: putative transcriptional regulator, GntR family [Thermoleophilia bacterium]|nr:putative transcriptional regulator, GntR family [Thermoleophilia bacterium]
MLRNTLDPYEDRYARRVFGMRSSVMRDLMAITQRPEVISLAGGLPDTGAFDKVLLEEIVGRIARDEGSAALQYGPTEGIRGVIDVIVEVMGTEGMEPDPANIIVTTGGQQVLDLFARTFLDPGDVVIAEGPTYPGVVPCFDAVQADVRHVPLDADGLDPEKVEALIDDLAREGLKPKYLYTIPTFQNPGGVTTTLERRHRLIELAHERDLIILEDNPYSLLRYEGEPVPTLRSLDQHERVAYLGTFSKIFSPGVRVGWIEAPRPILARINLMKQAADLCSSTFMQLLVTRFFTADGGDLWKRWVDDLNNIYRVRRDAMVEAIGEHFPPRRSSRCRRAGSSCGRRCRRRSTPPTCWRARSRRTSRSCRARGPTRMATGRTRCASTTRRWSPIASARGSVASAKRRTRCSTWLAASAWMVMRDARGSALRW